MICKLFRHKITSISLFEPNKETGGLGHVSHQSSKYSLYQKIGNFFIGAAPMIFGSIVLVIMLYFLVPNGKEAFLPLTREQSTPLGFLISMKTTLTTLFAWVNIQAWNFWIFLYLSFCLASHIAPSKADRKGMWKGLVWLVFLLILVNILTLSLKVDITGYVLKINVYLGILTAVFIYTTIISALHFILSHLLLLKRKNTS